jgi:hypothetical protein
LLGFWCERFHHVHRRAEPGDFGSRGLCVSFAVPPDLNQEGWRRLFDNPFQSTQ